MGGMSPDLDARLTLETPEQVMLSLPLAGVGSRMAAYGLDLLIRLALSLLVAVPAVFVIATYRRLGGYALAGALIGYFAVHFGYYVYFEVAHRGQTPGKRRMGLRAVKLNGTPVDLPASLLRNVLRVLDWLPGFYGLGVVAMFCSALEQRVGDVIAGTVVVREAPEAAPAQSVPAREDYERICRDLQLAHPERIRPSLSPREAEALSRLLARLPGLHPDAAQRLTERLVERLRGKVVDPDHAFDSWFEDPRRWELLLRFMLGRQWDEEVRHGARAGTGE